MKFIYINSVF